jgi:hypothetical protein
MKILKNKNAEINTPSASSQIVGKELINPRPIDHPRIKTQMPKQYKVALGSFSKFVSWGVLVDIPPIKKNNAAIVEVKIENTPLNCMKRIPTLSKELYVYLSIVDSLRFTVISQGRCNMSFQRTSPTSYNISCNVGLYGSHLYP